MVSVLIHIAIFFAIGILVLNKITKVINKSKKFVEFNAMSSQQQEDYQKDALQKMQEKLNERQEEKQATKKNKKPSTAHKVLFSIFCTAIVILMYKNLDSKIKSLINHTTTITEISENITTINNATPDNQSKPVYITGFANSINRFNVDDIVVDDALFFNKKIEMYQWVEKVTEFNSVKKSHRSKSYSYNKRWSEKHHETNFFKHPKGHQNPLKPSSIRSYATTAVINDIIITPEIISKLKTLPITNAPSLEGKPFENGFYYDSIQPPKVGDLRYSYSYTPAQQISIIGKLDGNKIVPYKKVLIVKNGTVSAEEMLKSQSPKSYTSLVEPALLAFFVISVALIVYGVIFTSIDPLYVMKTAPLIALFVIFITTGANFYTINKNFGLGLVVISIFVLIMAFTTISKKSKTN